VARSAVTAERPTAARRSGKPRVVVDALDNRLAAAQRVTVAAVVVLSALAVWRPLPDPFMIVKFTSVVVGAVALLALAAARAVRAGALTLPTGWAVWLAGAFAAALVLATLTADNIALATVGQHSRYFGSAAYLAYLIVFIVAIRLYANHPVRRLVQTFVVTLALAIAYGLVQLAGLDPYVWGAGRDEPVFSTFGNTNFAAAYVAAGLSVLVGAAVFGGLSKPWRIAAGAVAVVAIGYIAATRASQGLVAAAAGLAVVSVGWYLLRRRERSRPRPAASVRRWLPLAGVGAAAVVAAVGAATRVAGDVERSLGERLQFWQASLRIFRDQPVLGAGFDSFRDYFPAYRPGEHAVERGFQSTDATHNIVLAMLSGGGAVLAVAYLAFVGFTAWALVRGLRHSAPDRLVVLAMFGGMWAAYQVQALVSLDVPPLAFLHYLSAAVIVATAAPPRVVRLALPLPAARAGDWLPRSSSRLAAGTLAGVMVIALAATWVVSRPLRADMAAAEGTGVRADRALVAFDRAVDLAPWEAEYRILQARAFERDGQRDAALDSAIAAAELRAGSSRLALTSAELAAALDDADVAIVWTTKALERDPRNPDAYEGAAEVLEGQGRPERAQDLRTTADELRARFGGA
jgi:O-antigen ligase